MIQRVHQLLAFRLQLAHKNCELLELVRKSQDNIIDETMLKETKQTKITDVFVPY